MTVVANLEPHFFVHSKEAESFRDFSYPQKPDAHVAEISTLLSATLEGKQLSVTEVPLLEEKLLSEIRALSDFVRSVVDPAGWLKQTLQIDNPYVFECRVTPFAVVLTIDGYSYGQFADTWNTRRPSTISLGSTLVLDILPEELRGKVVVVNQGDGYYGSRSHDEIKATEKHELLHVLFNEFFCKHQFITTPELVSKLEQRAGISDSEAYRELARNLADAMFERARSEIISYCACGDYSIEPFEVDAQFWEDHINAVVAYLNRQSFNDSQADAILRVFVDAYEGYWRDTNRYLNIASNLPRTNNGLSMESIATLLVLSREGLDRA